MHIHGGDIYRNEGLIDFSANINPLGIPEGVLHAARKGIEQSAGYPDVRKVQLTESISKQEHLLADHILCGNGAAELIYSLIFSYRPKKALLLAPTFAEYEEALKGMDCEITYYHLKESDGFLVGSDYLDYITEDIDILFLCNPNNPTGVVMEKEMLMCILKKCEEFRIIMAVDECFIDFLERPELITMLPEIDEHPNLILFKAFTKLYAMAGLRLGYAMTSNLGVLKGMKRATQPWNVSTPAQLAGVAALKEKEYVVQTQKVIKQEKDYLIVAMKSMGCKIYASKANYIFFYHPGITMEAVKKEGFLIRDCSNYYNLQAGYFRIAVRLHKENQMLMEAFERVLLREER